MLTLNDKFLDLNIRPYREPRFYAKIVNSNFNIYLTSNNDIKITDGGAQFFDGSLTNIVTSSQEISPEKGFSTIGRSVLTFTDVGFTDLLRTIRDTYNDTLINNKVEMYFGYKGLAVSDYIPLPPMLVSQIDNSDLQYVLTVDDAQRFQRVKIFDNLPKQKVQNTLNFDTGLLEVVSTAAFQAVKHNPTWTDGSSNDKFGYLKVSGTDAFGESVTEIMRWTETGTTATHFNIDKRGCHGTRAVDIVGLSGGKDVEVEECVYLDLPVNKMIIALLTGDLYGEVGETIPAHWSAGVNAAYIDVNSYQDIDADINNTKLEFIDPEPINAKIFIAQQCQAPFNLHSIINNNGELQLKRFASSPQTTAGYKVFDYSNIISVSDLERDASAIKNVFSIDWGYSNRLDKYVNRNVFIDADSVSRNNFQSDPYEIKLKGIRNRGINNQLTLNNMASGIRARFSDPIVKSRATVLMRDAIEIEIGDIITLNLENLPDYASTDTLIASFEVQSISHDFVNGTTDMMLFSTNGIPTPIDFTYGADVTTINHSGWTELVVGAPGAGQHQVTGTDVGGTLTINGASDLPDGKYFYDGDIVISSGTTVTFNSSVFIDCNDFTMETNATLDGSGRAVVGGQGYFGGEDSGQEGVDHGKYAVFFNRFRRRHRSAGLKVPESRTSIEDFAIIPDANDSIDAQLPSKLYGNGGGAGMQTNVEDGSADPAAGAATSGGAGIMIICNNFFANSGSSINTSGQNSNIGSTVGYDSSVWRSGSSGFGWPGIVVVASKSRQAPAPNLYALVDARCGEWIEGNQSKTDRRPPSNGDWETYTPDDQEYKPLLPAARAFSNMQFGGGSAYEGSAYKFIRILKPGTVTQEEGKDIVETPQAPSLALSEQLNTPRTPLGNISTITGTVTPAAGDSAFSYAELEYRLQGKTQWVPVKYGITTESSFEVTSDGTTYEVRATAYNSAREVGGSTIETITTTVVNADSTTSEGTQNPTPPTEIKLPDITGLELINRIGNTPPDDLKFKSGNAEFKWDKAAVAVSGDIVILDPHFSTFKVVIKDSVDAVMRTEYTRDSFYTYTLEKNKKDGCGRIVKIDVSAIATTTYETPVASLTVENPQPAAVTSVSAIQTAEDLTISFAPPTDIDFIGVKIDGTFYEGSTVTLPPLSVRNPTYVITSVDALGDGATTNLVLSNPAPSAVTGITTSVGFHSIEVTYVKPSDYDFIGVDVRYRTTPAGPWSAKQFANSTKFVIGGLLQNTEYEIEITPKDTLGDGTLATVTTTTDNLQAADVSDLSNWATETNPVDLAFINANMASDAIDSTKIASLAAGKITAGTVTVQVNLGTGVYLDGANGLIQTNNAGYEMTMGAVSVPAESANPLVLFANDGTASYPFWIDSAGNGKFTGKITVTSGSSGLASFSDAGSLATQDTVDYGTDVSGTKPPSDADNTASQLAGSGVNVILAGRSSFGDESILISDWTSKANGTWSFDTGVKYSGVRSLKSIATAGDSYIYLSTGSGNYDMPIKPNSKWIFSAYVRSTAATKAGQLYIRTSNGTHYSVSFNTSASANTWTRVSGVVDLSANSSEYANIRVDNDGGSGTTMYFDNIMLEEQIGNLTTPSAYSAPGAEPNITWGNVYDDGSKPADNADKTQTAIQAGTTIGSGYLHLNGGTANIAIGASTTWQTDGIQLQYNSGNPRFYAGNAGGDYFQFDGTNVSMSGTLSIQSGSSGVSNLSDAGALATKNTADYATDISGTKPPANADATDYTDYRVSNNNQENSVLRIARPLGATYSGPSSSTGMIKITLPQSWTSTMMKFVIEVYNYDSSRSMTVAVGGYNYSTSSQWINEFAQIIGSTSGNNRVRFAHDGSKCCILLGDTTDTWQYLKVSVRDFQAGFQNFSEAQWDDGWAVSVTNSLTGITVTGDISDALLDAAAITGQGAFATQSSADWSTQVSGTGKPANNADVTQSALQAGTTMGAGYLHLNGGSAYLAIGASTGWETTGIQIQYNSGTPRWFAGNKTNEKYIEFDGTNLLIGRDTQLHGINYFGSTNRVIAGSIGSQIPTTQSGSGSCTALTDARGWTRLTNSTANAVGVATLVTYSGAQSVRGWGASDYSIFNSGETWECEILANIGMNNGSTTSYHNLVMGKTDYGTTPVSGNFCVGVQFYMAGGVPYCRPMAQSGTTNYFGTAFTILNSDYHKVIISRTGNSAHNIKLYNEAGSLVFDYDYSILLLKTSMENLIMATTDCNSTTSPAYSIQLRLYDCFFRQT